MITVYDMRKIGRLIEFRLFKYTFVLHYFTMEIYQIAYKGCHVSALNCVELLFGFHYTKIMFT